MHRTQGMIAWRERRENLVYGGIALGSVVFLLWVIPAYSPPYPGYGVSASLLPNLTIGTILALSVLALVRNLLAYSVERSKGSAVTEKTRTEDKVHLWHLTRFMIPCALLMPAVKWVGFIPAGVVFMLAIQYLCGQRRPVTLVLVAACTVGVLYVAMRYGLSVPMP